MKISYKGTYIKILPTTILQIMDEYDVDIENLNVYFTMKKDGKCVYLVNKYGNEIYLSFSGTDNDGKIKESDIKNNLFLKSKREINELKELEHQRRVLEQREQEKKIKELHRIAIQGIVSMWKTEKGYRFYISTNRDNYLELWDRHKRIYSNKGYTLVHFVKSNRAEQARKILLDFYKTRYLKNFGFNFAEEDIEGVKMWMNKIEMVDENYDG
jgi:hypothetical protein